MEMIRPVEKYEMTSAPSVCLFSAHNASGSSLQEGVEDHSPPPPYTADLVTAPQPAGMGYPPAEVRSPAATSPAPKKEPDRIAGESSQGSAVPRLFGTL